MACWQCEVDRLKKLEDQKKEKIIEAIVYAKNKGLPEIIIFQTPGGNGYTFRDTMEEGKRLIFCDRIYID